MDKSYLENLTYNQYKALFYNYAVNLDKKPEYIKYNEKEGTINAFVIRCNDLYVTNDMKRNNDCFVYRNIL